MFSIIVQSNLCSPPRLTLWADLEGRHDGLVNRLCISLNP
jgi:hypothetical protein